MTSTPPALRDYQIADLAYLIANPKTLYLHDPAVGKTPTVCVLMWYCWSELGEGSAWVMPKSLLEKNRQELLRFTPFNVEDVCVLDGSPKQIEKQLASGAKVFLMGFRRFSLSWRQLPIKCKNLFGDEIHLNGWGGHASQNTEALYEAMRSKFYRYVPMTGTLVSGRLDTAYPSIHVVEPRYYPSYEAFINFHAMKDFEGNIVAWRNQAKLREIFSRHGLRRTFEQVYGKEEKVIQVVDCYMTGQHREMFDQFKEQAYLELEQFILDGTLPGVGFIRARQLQEHPHQFPDLTRPGHFIDVLGGGVSGKEAMFEVALADHARTGEPLIAFSALVPQQQRLLMLAEKAGLKFGLLNGDTPQGERGRIDEAYRGGRLNGLICSPQVASVGFNWQWCGEQELRHMIFVSCDFLDTTILQAYRRAVRGGRKSPLLLEFYRYEDSIDGRVFQIIKNKSTDAQKADPSREIFDLNLGRK